MQFAVECDLYRVCGTSNNFFQFSYVNIGVLTPVNISLSGFQCAFGAYVCPPYTDTTAWLLSVFRYAPDPAGEGAVYCTKSIFCSIFSTSVAWFDNAPLSPAPPMGELPLPHRPRGYSPQYSPWQKGHELSKTAIRSIEQPKIFDADLIPFCYRFVTFSAKQKQQCCRRIFGWKMGKKRKLGKSGNFRQQRRSKRGYCCRIVVGIVVGEK